MWLDQLELAEQFFDQPVPFEPQWIILEGNLGLQVRAFSDHPRSPEPAFERTDNVVAGIWADAICSAHQANAVPPSSRQDIWDEYVACALEWNSA